MGHSSAAVKTGGSAGDDRYERAKQRSKAKQREQATTLQVHIDEERVGEEIHSTTQDRFRGEAFMIAIC
jgi:hypothetical protein